MPAGSFTADITAIRERARQKMGEGPVTGSYGKDPREVIAVLNEVLATEIVRWMRYTRHAISATGISRAQVAAEFTAQGTDERSWAAWPWLSTPPGGGLAGLAAVRSAVVVAAHPDDEVLGAGRLMSVLAASRARSPRW